METETPARLVPLLALLLLTAAAAAAQKAVGDACEGKDGAAGTCRSIADCPVVRDALRKGVAPTPCFFQGFKPVVCCPVPTTSPSPAPSRSTPPPQPASQSPPQAQRIATRMCHKYADAVYIYEDTFQIPPQTVKVDKCAVKGDPFIANGEEAALDEFPHMALLGYGTAQQPNWGCGGSLISDRFVLTAAHCFFREGFPKIVRLGELILKSTNEPNKHEDFAVAQSIPHPEYKDGASYNDVGLVRLDRDVTFTPSIRPLCLQVETKLKPDANFIASGWGYTDWTLPEISDRLLKVSLPIHETEVCQGAYKTLSTTLRLAKGVEEESMVCAGSLNDHKDTCMGDSGGPLQVKLKTPYCMYSIVGITSFGKGSCGTGKAPAIYTRVSHYVSWIESVVWPNQK